MEYWLIDTPGFGNAYEAENVMRNLSGWLDEFLTDGSRMVAAILYFHRITDPRISGDALQGLQMFKELCNPALYSRTYMATTGWEALRGQPGDVGQRREQELRQKPEFWGSMMSHHSEILRIPEISEAARDVLAAVACPFDSDLAEIRGEIPLVLPFSADQNGKNKLDNDVAQETKGLDPPSTLMGRAAGAEGVDVTKKTKEWTSNEERTDAYVGQGPGVAGYRKNLSRSEGLDNRIPQQIDVGALTWDSVYLDDRRKRNMEFEEKLVRLFHHLYEVDYGIQVTELRAPFNLMCNHCMNSVGRWAYHSECLLSLRPE